MNESVLLARLTLMLLRASVQVPERLPADYGVIVLPSRSILTWEEALIAMARLDSGQVVMGAIDGNTLVVSTRSATETERQGLILRATNLEEAIHRLNKANDSNALVRVVGFREELSVSENVVRKWLWSTVCSRCSMSVGLPLSDNKALEIGVLYLGPSETGERPTRN